MHLKAIGHPIANDPIYGGVLDNDMQSAQHSVTNNAGEEEEKKEIDFKSVVNV